jgi:hypothetical protein
MLKTYSSTFSLAQPTTWFAVYRSLDPGNGSYTYVFDSRDSNSRQLHGRGPYGVETYANTDLYTTGVTQPYPSFEEWGGTFNGTASDVWRNGQQVTTGYAGYGALTGFTLGGLSTSGTGGYWYGHTLVAEVLYYTGTMTDAQRGLVMGWLDQKYALY